MIRNNLVIFGRIIMLVQFLPCKWHIVIEVSEATKKSLKRSRDVQKKSSNAAKLSLIVRDH